MLREVERRERRQRELDYKIKLNERRLSEKYLKMAKDGKQVKRPKSLLREDKEPAVPPPPAPLTSKRKSVTIDEPLAAHKSDSMSRKIEENKQKRETLIRKIASYDELESKKKQRLSEQEMELRDSEKLIVEGASLLKQFNKDNDDDDDDDKENSIASKQPTIKFPKSSIEPKRETLVSVSFLFFFFTLEFF